MFTMFNLCRATPEEVSRPLPGDEVIPRPTGSATHAITIDAPPDQVWPWLVQMGCGRAGWYSYDFVDNRGRHSATTINPAWQHLAIGDVMPAVPGTRDAFVVMAFIYRLGHFIMEQRHLVRIKWRAERQALAGSSFAEERRAVIAAGEPMSKGKV